MFAIIAAGWLIPWTTTSHKDINSMREEADFEYITTILHPGIKQSSSSKMKKGWTVKTDWENLGSTL